MKRKHVNAVGKEIASDFGLVKGPTTRYNQTQSNCFGIAASIARSFGYAPPESLYELLSDIEEARANRLWGTSSFRQKSPASIIVRVPDDATNVHVAFEYRGKEYNYGPATKDGFPIDLRLPLTRAC